MSAFLAFVVLGHLGAQAEPVPRVVDAPPAPTSPAENGASPAPSREPSVRVVEPPATPSPSDPPSPPEGNSYESSPPARALPKRVLSEEEREAEEERLEEEREREEEEANREEEERERLEDERHAKSRTVGPFLRFGGTFGSQGFDSEAVGIHEADGAATRFRTGGQMSVMSYGGRGEFGFALGFRSNSFAVIPRVSFELSYGEEIRRTVTVAEIDHTFRLRPLYFAGAAGVEFQFAERIAHASLEIGAGGTSFEIAPIEPMTNFAIESETRSSLKARTAFGGQIALAEGFAFNFEGAAQFYFPTYYHGGGTLLSIGMGFEFDGSRLPKKEGALK